MFIMAKRCKIKQLLMSNLINTNFNVESRLWGLLSLSRDKVATMLFPWAYYLIEYPNLDLYQSRIVFLIIKLRTIKSVF